MHRTHTFQTQKDPAGQIWLLVSLASDYGSQVWGSTTPPDGQFSSHREVPRRPAKTLIRKQFKWNINIVITKVCKKLFRHTPSVLLLWPERHLLSGSSPKFGWHYTSCQGMAKQKESTMQQNILQWAQF